MKLEMTLIQLFTLCAVLNGLVFGVMMLVLSYRQINDYQSKLLDHVSNLEHKDLRWIKLFILVVAASFVLIPSFLLATNSLIGKNQIGQLTAYRTFLLATYAVVLYWLSINGYRQSQTLKLVLEPSVSEFPSSRITRKIHTVMKEHFLCQNPDLRLEDIAIAAKLSPRTISEILNNDLEKNFYQFVNEYRIAEIKTLLLDPANDHLKIMSLAIQAGFNSKATFNRIFRQKDKHPTSGKKSSETNPLN